jgi:hypothetical protein
MISTMMISIYKKIKNLAKKLDIPLLEREREREREREPCLGNRAHLDLLKKLLCVWALYSRPTRLINFFFFVKRWTAYFLCCFCIKKVTCNTSPDTKKDMSSTWLHFRFYPSIWWKKQGGF